MSASDEKPKAYCTLPLAEGFRPFKLSEEETRLDGDWWAWQFLRHNPFYRRDYFLQSTIPESLHGREGMPLERLRGFPPRPMPGPFKNLDSRRFCAHGKVLSGSVTWPKYKRLTINTYRLLHPELKLADVFVREFDSAASYGIAAWFDPDKSVLPQLKVNESWFYCLSEPLWQAADQSISLNEVWHQSEQFGRSVVGFNPDNPFLDLIHSTIEKSDDELKTFKLVPAAEPLARYPIFRSSSEFAFLINLDGDICAQLRPIEILAVAYRNRIENNDEGFDARPVEIEYHPLILSPEYGPFWMYSKLTAAIHQLENHNPWNKKNWRLIVIETAFDISSQMKSIHADLNGQQGNIDVNENRPFTRIKRLRNAYSDNFWLKKALCILEIQQNLICKNYGKIPNVNIVAEIIFNPVHKLHNIIHPGSNLETGGRTSLNESKWNGDEFKDALKKAKQISLGLYEYLAGMSPLELRKNS